MRIKTLTFLLLFSGGLFNLFGQQKKFDILPAISYSPETKLTLGGIGYYYPNFSNGDTTTRQSNINFLAVYTTAKQIVLEGTWDIFSEGNNYRYRGLLWYNKYPDRLYGVGNEANWRINRLVGDVRDTINYIPYSNQFIRFNPTVLKKLSPSLSAGLTYEMEYVWDFKTVGDQLDFMNQKDSLAYGQIPIEGARSGLGVTLLYDTRDYLLNPLKGSYLEMSALYYTPLLGSKYTFGNILMDFRKYVNPIKNHTIALRGYVNLRPSPAEENIQYRALSRVGGRDLVRGYFKGTYADAHMTAFELEYRLPLWPEDTDATFWQFWRKVGLVGFLSGAQVFPSFDQWAVDEFNLAGGVGLRLLFNKETRVNIRIDYGWGLTADSNGIGKKQSGLYFFLAEAF